MHNHKDWTFVYSEANSLVVNDIFFHGFTEYKSVPGMFNVLLYINRSGIQKCQAPLSELQRIREEGKIFLDSDYRRKFTSELQACVTDFEVLYSDYKMVLLSSAEDKMLLSIFERYNVCLQRMFAYYQVSGGRCYPLLEEWVKKRMAEVLQEEDSDETYALMLKNTEMDALERESVELHYISELDHVSDEILILHSQKYPLLFINIYDEAKIIESLRVRIKTFQQGSESAESREKLLIDEHKKIKKSQTKIEALINHDVELIEALNYLRGQGRLRFEYKNWKNGAEYRFIGLFKEIAHRASLSVGRMLNSYLVKDVKSLILKGAKIPDKECVDRKQVSVFYTDSSKKLFMAGAQAEKFLLAQLVDKDVEVTELKGVIANRGKAQGRARVILPMGWEDLQKEMQLFKNGEVLITTMTEPNLIVLMKKAVAIVTNQGGITSHAAVVSRELNIPCVIGTLRATEVIKTGDLVEVDAERGVVTIIERKK